MPIYEYHCEKCDQDFEYLVFGSEKPNCPSCKGKKVSKLMSRCGFISKGSGGETVSSIRRGILLQRLRGVQLRRLQPLTPNERSH